MIALTSHGHLAQAVEGEARASEGLNTTPRVGEGTGLEGHLHTATGHDGREEVVREKPGVMG